MIGYIAIAVFITTVYLAIDKFTDFSRIKKVLITLASFILLAMLYQYESFNDRQRQNTYTLLLAYENNKTLSCNDMEVNKKNFNYSSGGHSFLGKATAPYSNAIVSIFECKKP